MQVPSDFHTSPHNPVLPNFPSFQKHPGLRNRTGTSHYLAILAELGVQVGGQRIPCAPRGLGLEATTQLWSRLPLHAPATCWEDRSVTGEQ